MTATPSKILQAAFGALLSIGYFAVIAGLMLLEIPWLDGGTKTSLLAGMANQLTAAFVLLVGYAFGSSVGSQRKDELNTIPPEILQLAARIKAAQAPKEPPQ